MSSPTTTGPGGQVSGSRARRLQSRAPGLPLRKVTLYKNDLALHERECSGRGSWTLHVPNARAPLVQDTLSCRLEQRVSGDSVLSSLEVQTPSSNNSKSAYPYSVSVRQRGKKQPSYQPTTRRVGVFAVNDRLGDFLESCRGAQVHIRIGAGHAEATLQGRLAGSGGVGGSDVQAARSRFTTTGSGTNIPGGNA
ncbi:unnamed protein product, partial [Amoebophrya sp. A25]|eukprot:GSA25T00025218001.1